MTYRWVEEFSIAQASVPNILEFTLVLRMIVDELAFSSLKRWGREIMAVIAGQRKIHDTAISAFIMLLWDGQDWNRRTSKSS